MYPHERSLVKKFEGKPFAILGINSDQDRKKLQSVLLKEEITWRSWWDGGSTQGPIATTYRVRGWPTLFFLDHKGVIRVGPVHHANLEGVVTALLAEMEKEKTAVK